MMKYLARCVAFAAVLVSCHAAAGETATVDQKGLTFSVPTLTVNKGTVVTFKNSDDTSHNILIRGNGVVFNSGLQGPGTAFTAPFRKPGSYEIFCGIHPRMNMTVIVK
jgi:cytochrome c peroxidase